MSRPSRTGRAFTIIELLVVVSIIALLIGILLPAIGKARDQAKQTQSLTNLRNLGTAHATYAAEWNDRQFTLCVDTISSYGNSLAAAFTGYVNANGGYSSPGNQHPGAILGWGHVDGNGAWRLFMYRCDGNMANASLTIPINFIGGVSYFGSFRLVNCRQFNQYVSGRFYDKVFYAPKDTIVIEAITSGGTTGFDCFEDPGEYCDSPPVPGSGDLPKWSSYVMSPAAMFAPQVMQRLEDGDDNSGWKNPWTLPAGMRSPAMGQARYPALKTHMLEHHWLQSRRSECNPAFTSGSFSCEPFYFNMAWESSPMTLFYDGHVESVGVRKCERADGRQLAQSGNEYGLWSRDTIFGANGYFINAGYDDANTSFHILTTDGILGRDMTAD